MPNTTPESTHENINLDIDTQLVNPSLELYTSIKSLSAELYQDTRETLIETHNKVSDLSTEFYNRPVETTKEWYGQATNLGSETLVTINNKLIPEFIAIYDSSIRELKIIGTQWSNAYQTTYDETIEFCKTFYNHPTETLNVLYNQLQNFTSRLTDLMVDIYHQAEVAITLTYQSSITALDLFYKEPKATAQALYYDVLSNLLDLYAGLINFILQLLGNSVQVML